MPQRYLFTLHRSPQEVNIIRPFKDVSPALVIPCPGSSCRARMQIQSCPRNQELSHRESKGLQWKSQRPSAHTLGTSGFECSIHRVRVLHKLFVPLFIGKGRWLWAVFFLTALLR